MDMSEYMDIALMTAGGPDGRVDLAEAFINGAMGLAGESGEVIDEVKKHLFQGHQLNKRKIAEELGDVLWYVCLVAHSLGFSLDEVAEMNLRKLHRRYPKGHFDVEDSIRRADLVSKGGETE
ncbi:MAG TPA: nucleoside triphosphate pyrophosphohydrolase family protein [Alicyclobacillus sp.]|nr:nucleoside triphosphate pyrophosphohydrolase family protein [Alicyclobacillus sp.]